MTNAFGGPNRAVRSGTWLADPDNPENFAKPNSDGSINVSVTGGTGGTVAVSSVIPGVAATNLGKAEDAAHTSGDVGVEILSVRQDGAGVALANTTLDYQPIVTDGFNLVKMGLFDTTTGVAVSMTDPVQTFVSNSFLNVAAGTATTTVKSGAGTLAAVTINTKGAASNTLTIYDNTAGSGTKIAVIDTTVSAGQIRFDLAFGTGLTCVSATGTGADYTVTYR